MALLWLIRMLRMLLHILFHLQILVLHMEILRLFQIVALLIILINLAIRLLVILDINSMTLLHICIMLHCVIFVIMEIIPPSLAL